MSSSSLEAREKITVALLSFTIEVIPLRKNSGDGGKHTNGTDSLLPEVKTVQKWAPIFCQSATMFAVREQDKARGGRGQNRGQIAKIRRMQVGGHEQFKIQNEKKRTNLLAAASQWCRAIPRLDRASQHN